MRLAVLALLASLLLAPAALAGATSSDSARDPSLPGSQDISHVGSTIDPDTGVWTVDVTFYDAPSPAAWGNLYALLYGGPSQCADAEAIVARMQEASTIPGTTSVYGSVPLPGNMGRAAQSVTKAFDGDTVELKMTDMSLIGAAPTCLIVSLSHGKLLDKVGPMPFEGAATTPSPSPTPSPAAPKLAVGVAGTSLRLKSSSVRVTLKPFNQAAKGVVTLRSAGAQIGRASYKAGEDDGATVPIRLSASALKTLRRKRSLPVTITATAQAGGQLVTRAVRARVRP